MSTNTIPQSYNPAMPKGAFKEAANLKPVPEFFHQVKVALSVHTNRVTKLNALSFTVVILALCYLGSILVNMALLGLPSSRLEVPLNLLTAASYLLTGSYLFPVVHHVMSFYQKKRDKRWKAFLKASEKEAVEPQDAKVSGEYSI